MHGTKKMSLATNNSRTNKILAIENKSKVLDEGGLYSKMKNSQGAIEDAALLSKLWRNWYVPESIYA